MWFAARTPDGKVAIAQPSAFANHPSFDSVEIPVNTKNTGGVVLQVQNREVTD